jgi:hypothetical protein
MQKKRRSEEKKSTHEIRERRKKLLLEAGTWNESRKVFFFGFIETVSRGEKGGEEEGEKVKSLGKREWI